MNWLNILHSLHVYQYSTLSHTAGAMNLLRYSEQRHWIYRLIWYIGWTFLIACITTITPLYWMTSTTFSNRPYHPKNNNWFLTNTILSPPLCRKKNILASISYWIYQLGLTLNAWGWNYLLPSMLAVLALHAKPNMDYYQRFIKPHSPQGLSSPARSPYRGWSEEISWNMIKDRN